MNKTKKKLLKLVSRVDREDVLEYLYSYTSGKLLGGGKTHAAELSEADKIRSNIFDMLSCIKRRDILNYIGIIVSDIVEEQKIEVRRSHDILSTNKQNGGDLA